jgi:hypothetical protein
MRALVSTRNVPGFGLLGPRLRFFAGGVAFPVLCALVASPLTSPDRSAQASALLSDESLSLSATESGPLLLALPVDVFDLLAITILRL